MTLLAQNLVENVFKPLVKGSSGEGESKHLRAMHSTLVSATFLNREKLYVTLGACQNLGPKVTRDSGSKIDHEIIDFVVFCMG